MQRPAARPGARRRRRSGRGRAPRPSARRRRRPGRRPARRAAAPGRRPRAAARPGRRRCRRCGRPRARPRGSGTRMPVGSAATRSSCSSSRVAAAGQSVATCSSCAHLRSGPTSPRPRAGAQRALGHDGRGVGLAGQLERRPARVADLAQRRQGGRRSRPRPRRARGARGHRATMSSTCTLAIRSPARRMVSAIAARLVADDVAEVEGDPRAGRGRRAGGAARGRRRAVSTNMPGSGSTAQTHPAPLGQVEHLRRPRRSAASQAGRRVDARGQHARPERDRLGAEVGGDLDRAVQVVDAALARPRRTTRVGWCLRQRVEQVAGAGLDDDGEAEPSSRRRTAAVRAGRSGANGSRWRWSRRERDAVVAEAGEHARASSSRWLGKPLVP